MVDGYIPLPTFNAVNDATNPPEQTVEQDRRKKLFTKGSGDKRIVWNTTVPPDYNGSPVFKVNFAMATATSGNVVLEVRIWKSRPATSDNWDTPSFDSINTVTVAVPATAGLLAQASITLTNNDAMQAYDEIEVELLRNQDAAGDTASGTLELGAVAWITYTKA